MRLTKFIISIWMVTGLVPATVCAQHNYTLEECKEKALLNNVKIKNAGNNVEAAEQERKEARTKYFPSISANGTGFLSDKGLVESEIKGQVISLVDDGLFGGVSATLPLFTGGQIVYTNRLADLQLEVSKIQKSQTLKEVLLTTETYYWQIVMLKAKLETLRSMECMIDTLYKDVSASVEAGVTTRNDLLQVQLKRNDFKSKRVTLENALAVSRMVLGQYIGEQEDSIGVSSSITPGQLPDSPESLQCNHSDALLSTDEYRLLQSRVSANKLEYKKTLGKYMPSVALGGGYMCDNLLDRSHPFWIGFATVSVPISDWWGGSHALKRKKLEIRSAENTFSDGSDKLLIKMQKSWNDVNDAYEQIKIAGISIKQSEENLRLQKDYYHAGICTMSDLLEAQMLSQQSRDQYVESYARYEIKCQEYLRATGR